MSAALVTQLLSQGETCLPNTHTHTRWLESRQINLRDGSEDAASLPWRTNAALRWSGGEGPAAGAMKSHGINIHEPSHLSERNSFESWAVEPEGEDLRGGGGEETGRQDWWGVAVAAVSSQSNGGLCLSFLVVRIRRDALWGLLFEPWTHPTKLHHLLQHTHTHTHTTNFTHQLPGEYCWGADLRGFSPPQYHSWCLTLSLVRCALGLWLQTQVVEGTQLETTNNKELQKSR